MLDMLFYLLFWGAIIFVIVIVPLRMIFHGTKKTPQDTKYIARPQMSPGFIGALIVVIIILFVLLISQRT